MTERKLLQVRLTPQARAGITELAMRHGLTITALFEAIGLHHDAVSFPDQTIRLARRIDRERHSR